RTFSSVFTGRPLNVRPWQNDDSSLVTRQPPSLSVIRRPFTSEWKEIAFRLHGM
ncbi:hypothetical protein M9458_018221, partial [Cirrhinus mrigala]